MKSEPILVQDCVLAIFDRTSPVNTDGLGLELFRNAREKSHGPSDLAATWRQAIKPFIGSGNVAIWLTLFAGVYKVASHIHATSDPQANLVNDAFIENTPGPLTILDCSSGDILVGSLDDLMANRGALLASVAPGKYLAGLTRDSDQEVKHEFLESVSEYPPEDGPDWTVHIWPLR